ncbi:PspC domain-containing protein [Actinoplanes sp. TFC3]|uniref:PspC domain-containing protein n=1 Tax=Actinoplanes sp. TFC3 TaxID=1710355 RepID=UPI0008365029|nr:PspC domain-containing protein [Actinoplanes sp. TFC3]
MTDQAVPPPPPQGAPPPAPDGPTWSRENLIRPRQGRYLAGVSGAIARATNTDPVLWRVVLAVLAVIGGIGALAYLLGWLLIPAENDTASPIESLLGRGRSGMTPLSVVLLAAATIVVFAFVVNDGFRAALLAIAVLVGGVLVLKRSGRTAASPPVFDFPPATAPPAPAEEPTAAFAAATEPAPTVVPPDDPVTPADPVAPPLPPRWSPPAGGYRAPFAPHGPFAQTSDQPSYEPPAASEPTAPKPPKERSKLGRITFFGVVVVLGVLAAIDNGGASIPISGYFAAALATIALGLIAGAWFGRARGLITLAVLVAAGMGISSAVENFGGQVTNNSYRPATVAAVADRYDFTIGNATLDLRALDFTGQDQNVTIAMRVGQVKVLLPDTVDTSVTVDVSDGRVNLFGQDHDGRDLGSQEISDLGADGKGRGTLHLSIQMDAGNVEVNR